MHARVGAINEKLPSERVARGRKQCFRILYVYVRALRNNQLIVITQTFNKREREHTSYIDLRSRDMWSEKASEASEDKAPGKITSLKLFWMIVVASA